jgi:hypothetical protein
MVKAPLVDKARHARKALHIVTTSFLESNEVLVGYSDGTGAIFEAEELEKLRPKPKRTLSACPAGGPPLIAST